MCYDVETGTRIALKYAKHRGDAPEVIDALEEEIKRLQTFKPLYAQSGFAHPNLLVFANDKPFTPQTFQWGLIPHWVRDQKTAATMMKQTLNARAETMFDKPSFRDSAKNILFGIMLRSQKDQQPYLCLFLQQHPILSSIAYVLFLTPLITSLH